MNTNMNMNMTYNLQPTPFLLFLLFLLPPGVGPAALLEKHGVAVVADKKGVGANLHDHLQIRAVYRLSEEAETLNKHANSIFGQIRMGLEYVHRGVV